MEWIEANPLPEVCQSCSEPDCWECDYAGLRWYLSPLDELKSQRAGHQKAMERHARKVIELDQKIAELEKQLQREKE